MSELWRPSEARVADANLTRFIKCLNARRDLRLLDYTQLYAWSLAHPEDFWSELARFADVRADWGSGPVLENPTAMPGARFFPNARLNFAANLLKFADDQPALLFRNERGGRSSLSYRQLRAEVGRIADGLRAAGIVAGDRVAGFLPNIPEAVIAMLATTSLGAIWSSCSPDFGVHGVLDRFGQIAPKALFTADGYFYAGKKLDSLAQIGEVLAQLPSVRQVVLIPYVDADTDPQRLGAAAARTRLWHAFGTAGKAPVFVDVPFNHPVYILYSSGTTGAPKCIVHGAGGTLLQHQKEHSLHVDLRRTDRLFYFTTCGWMMWNWLVSGLATGATLVLYDGSPFHPKPTALWTLAAEERITIFGTSAKYLSALEKHEFETGDHLDLNGLRTLLSTGSPLLPEGFDFVYRSIKHDIQLASISGGTDIVSCFALGCPTRPVYRGEIQCRGLGMAVDVLDEQGKPVRGERGELVCTAPFPSMPVGFWNDPGDAKYRAAYFERFPGIWHHGDYAAITEHDGVVIYGRSDAVLNPGGVRIGTAEIYSAVEGMPQVAEALAIGQEWEGDVRVVLFVRLQPGCALDEALRRDIRATIRAQTTARHVPAKVIAVPDIPRTLSGKITELAVRNVVHGQPVKNLDALANPASLEFFRDLPELQA
ncbi:MAG: acetoacetate--CoA ligase [Proteobacteria bacterium]|nr:acetoacetate--CoA ligase [Pseudomonadota bacterium]